ncbi:hypothetical protein QYE76_004935 [Lolium multiflorum]|uniref:Uncharacterized protein n=1 Tax=Lolium multiflorum TaxID=4521 RepID=A0AAD8RS14_LOLMU|nr:hypothetical protein QYE76_004935 [Lolium multiflorum]
MAGTILASLFLAPTSAKQMLHHHGTGAAAGGRLLLNHGAGAAAGAGRALLFGPVIALAPVTGRAAPRRPLCTNGGGDQEPSYKDEIFRDAMQQLWVGVIVRGDKKLVDDLATVAKKSLALLSKMVTDVPSPLPALVYEDLVLVKVAFLRVEGECNLGCITSNTVEQATRALKMLAEVFLGNAEAEALGAKPEILNIKNATTKAEKNAYVKKLASAFSNCLNKVEAMYLRQAGLAGGEGAATVSRRHPLSKQPSDNDFADAMAKRLDEAMEYFFPNVVVRGDKKLIDDLTNVAKEAKALLDKMINEARSPLTDLVCEDLIKAHTAFHAVERQCKLGYVTSNSVEAATQALRKMAEAFMLGAAANALGHYPRIDYDGSKDASEEAKATYLKKLATAFSRLLHEVKTAYDGGAPRD